MLEIAHPSQRPRFSAWGQLLYTQLSPWRVAGPICGALVALVITAGISFNLVFFTTALITALALTMRSFRDGALFGIAYMCVKPALWRLAYHLDHQYALNPTVDLLRYSAGIILAGLCFWILVNRALSHRPLVRTSLDVVTLLFISINLVSVFNPHSSLFVGFAGFERNIFPTVFMVFVGREAIRSKQDWTRFTKVTISVAVVALLYGLKHALTGIFAFETTFFSDLFAQGGFDGWLTVGINGVEFRNFSTFFGYMEFTFTLALWAILLFTSNVSYYGRRYRALKWLFGALVVTVLALSMERTPILMIIAGLIVAWFVVTAAKRRKMVVLVSVALVLMIMTAMVLFERQLEVTGIAKLQRLAELSDPSRAASIQDRAERMWAPTLDIIAGNPMGVGVGYGSETIASSSVSSSQFRVQPHNEFLQKALESGIIGAGLFVALLLLLWRRLYRAARAAQPGWLRGALAAACGAVVAFTLCGQVNLPFSGAQGTYFWFSVGAALGLVESNLPQRSAESGKSKRGSDS